MVIDHVPITNRRACYSDQKTHIIHVNVDLQKGRVF